MGSLSDRFRGITTNGKIEEGLFKIESTGVTTKPVVDAAMALLDGLTDQQKIRTVVPVEDKAGESGTIAIGQVSQVGNTDEIRDIGTRPLVQNSAQGHKFRVKFVQPLSAGRLPRCQRVDPSHTSGESVCTLATNQVVATVTVFGPLPPLRQSLPASPAANFEKGWKSSAKSNLVIWLWLLISLVAPSA